MGFDEMGQLLVMYFGFVRYLGGGKKNKGNTMRQCIELKEAHDSVRLVVLYNILTEFDIPVKW